MPNRHTQAFTLTELLIVIAIIGLLIAALFFNSRAGQRAARHRIYDTYAQTCITTAEQKRNYLTNILTLPDSCVALGDPHPPGITQAAITDDGDTYTLRITASEYQSTHTFAKKPALP